MAIETPEYKVIKKYKNIEIRQYSDYIQAEVEIMANDYKDAIEHGFDILAGYIFGNNRSRQKIDMTAPVKTSRPEKIAMTTPVKVYGEAIYNVSFIMPSRYSLETLPVPDDERINFKKIDAHKIAAIRFSGFFRLDKIQQNIEMLKEFIAKENLKYEGEFIIAGYSPPFIPGFLQRNEVMIKLAEISTVQNE
ncbi:MAG: heme-binding protein [Actinobacteria bacterium]|nr:heme-binding protein [Actinomycetota bacterium]